MISYEDIDVLAKTVWGEARGEPFLGRYAVACVVLNLVAFRPRGRAFWWGGSIRAVCLKPWQFSCWNKNDPNSRKIARLSLQTLVDSMCLQEAVNAITKNASLDPTEGATHYHSIAIDKPGSWGEKIEYRTQVGSHVFYRRVM